MQCRRGWRRWAESVSLASILGACSGADVTPAAAPSEATDAEQVAQVLSDVGERCGEITPPLAVTDGRDDIFVEAVIIAVPKALAGYVALGSLPELARSRSVRLVAAPHVLGSFDAATSMALGQSADSSTPLALTRWSVRPRHVDDETSVLELELELSTAERPNNTLRFSVTTRDDEPSLAGPLRDAPGPNSLLVVFRSFRVHGEAQLRAIFECKMRQRARYLQRTGRQQ